MGSACKYIQYALLNLSTVDEKYDVVIVNPNNYKKNHETTYTHTMYVIIHYTHMYTHIRKYRARMSFMTDYFTLIYKTRVFMKYPFLLYNKGIFYNVHYLFTSCYPIAKLINQ